MSQLQINFDILSIGDLTQLIEKAKTKRAEKQEATKAALIEEITAKATQLGISLNALLGEPAAPQNNVRKVRGDAGKPVAAKFRGPKDETWSGRGRMPRWLADATSRGKSKEEFAI